MRRVTLLLVCVLITVLVAGCGKSSTASGTSIASSLPSVAAAYSGASGASAAPTAGGSATCPATNTTNFAKSKFVLHVGLAAGTFHRYLYKPFKAGTFSKGATGRVSGLIKAGATALFDEHEIRLAISDVKASPVLCKVLIAPLSAVADQFGAMKSKVTGGDTSSVDKANSDLAAISSTSSKDGAPITESTDESAG